MFALTGNDEEDEKIFDRVMSMGLSDRTKLDLTMQYKMLKGRISHEDYKKFEEREFQISIAMIDAQIDAKYGRR